MRSLCAVLVLASSVSAQQSTQPAAPSTALTIYNENFAVARTAIDLDLRSGRNEVSTTRVTSQLEPDSVILRDPSGLHTFRILEQNYDAGVIDQDSMLRKYEGKTIDFEVGPSRLPSGEPVAANTPVIVSGTIIRAPRNSAWPNQYSQFVSYQQSQPLIEVNGHLEFVLPGTPLFPASTDGLLLEPTLRWQIESERPQKFPVELAYITQGLSWSATYNVVVPDSGAAASEEKSGLTGWVTIQNQSGSEFPSARIKLMAGDVAKITPQNQYQMRDQIAFGTGANIVNGQVTQKPFDDFHLYDLNRTVSLLNNQTMQVQFVDASGVTLSRSYRYNGAAEMQPYQSNNGYVNQQPEFGIDPANTKIQIVESFKNSSANHLGMPLPAGRIRLYRRDSDGQMEFVGESMINHTPADDTVRIVTGNAFDIKASRRQTDFHVNMQDRIVDESFEIHLTSQKAEPVTVSVVEPMYRGVNWEIRDKSADYAKLDARTIEFPVRIPAKGDATLTYSVRYTW